MAHKLKKFDAMKARKASLRREILARTGDPAQWRKRPVYDLDASSSKAKKNKLKCRGRVRMKEWL